ncbi:hypothetical protein A9Q84_05090 [Halobacteriovorax marinus]|uniref:Glycosyltransferase n=1 Tax=Halobacteriovorax marinus TaxID=97084 RepID=A0A1Y5FAR7_9BACT|nr:hypothetical protein A9Q84_05090 [Halobacteriovorax marinus]
MKKVLLITSRSDTGGGPKHVFELLTFLKNKGLEEITVCAPFEKPYGEKFQELSSNFIPIKHRSFSLISFFKILLFCKDENIQVIHSHGRGAGIYSKLLSFFGFKITHTFHGVHEPKNIKDSFKNLIDRILKYNINLGIFVSESEKSLAKKIGLAPDNNQIIYNGIDRNIFDKTNSPEEDSIIFGTLSRLDPQKGNDLLIDNFIKFHQEFKNTKLLIAGGGEQLQELENKITKKNAQEYITLLGEISDPQALLSNINFYVSNSRGEGLPYAVLEAMASKTPCILSNVSGHNSILSPKELFELTSAENFGDVYKYVNLHKDEIIEKNLALIDSKFNLEKNFQMVLESYLAQ